VRALRSAIDRLRRPAVSISNARIEYNGSGQAAADRAAQRVCRGMGYDEGTAQNGEPRQRGSSDGPFLTSYVCWDRPAT
jgi:hypothetical protein